MESGRFIPDINSRGETFQNRFDENGEKLKFGSGWPQGGGAVGITPVDWLSLSDSKDTADGGPVVVVTETTPTQLVVTTTEQDTNIDTN